MLIVVEYPLRRSATQRTDAGETRKGITGRAGCGALHHTPSACMSSCIALTHSSSFCFSSHCGTRQEVSSRRSPPPPAGGEFTACLTVFQARWPTAARSAGHYAAGLRYVHGMALTVAGESFALHDRHRQWVTQ